MEKMFKKMFNKSIDEKGSIVVIVAVAMVALLGFTALVADIGFLYFQRRHLQNAADAAALAAAWGLPGLVDESNYDDDPFVVTGRLYAEKHNVNHDSDDTTVYVINPEDSAGNPIDSQIKVIIDKDYSLYFGKVLGLKTSRVRAEATAAKQLFLTNVMPFAPLPENYLDDDLPCMDNEDVEPLLEETCSNNCSETPYCFYCLKDEEYIDPDDDLEYAKDRLDDFKLSIRKYNPTDEEPNKIEPTYKIGVVTGTKGTPSYGNSNFGFLNLLGEGQAGATVISGWIKDGPPDIIEGSLILSSNQGNMNSLFTSNDAAITDNLLEYGNGDGVEFYVILPHPSVEFKGTDVPVRWGDYLIAKMWISADDIDEENYICGTSGEYRLIAEIQEVYNYLDKDDQKISGAIEIKPYLVD